MSIAVDYVAALGASGQKIYRTDVLKGVLFLSATTFFSLLAVGFRDLHIAMLVGAGLAALCAVTVAIELFTVGETRRKAWLAVSLVSNLTILAFFKYFDFFVESVASLLDSVGFAADFPTLHIILPVGLSFYTFQAISRSVDSYRLIYTPQRNLLNYAAFHSFFPQLVAGPIERVGHLMPQFETVRPIDWTAIRAGALLALWGLFQKVVVADNLAPLADTVFQHPEHQSGGATLAGVLAFTFQIYGDFGGYSNMARGIAMIIGFDLMQNFKQPYLSRSPREFWQRWHISLSAWLRDYLYIPLGGSRGGHTSRNLMITMLLGGLWHGAAWTFVAWGAFHGAIQVVYRWMGIDRSLDATPPNTVRGVGLHVFWWAATFVLVMIGWVFFRASDFADAAQVLVRLLRFDGYHWDVFAPIFGYAWLMVAADLYMRFRHHIVFAPPFLLRYSFVIVLLMAVSVFSGQSGARFIYFDF